MDFIQGQKFKSLGVNFAPTEKKDGDYDGLKNGFNACALNDINIVYTHTIYAKELVETIKDIDSFFVVITHNADINFDLEIPDNILKWWSQNVNIEDPRIESLPIGLENDWWFSQLRKKEKMIAKLQESRILRNYVYMNFNVGTNPVKRTRPYELLRDKSWITVEMRTNGQMFDEYLDNIYNHEFVVCPEGNGMDTHRTWESLYMGTIPIEKRNLNNKFYNDLPICFVDDWEEVTRPFLESEHERIKSLVWNKSKLTFEYWKNRIYER